MSEDDNKLNLGTIERRYIEHQEVRAALDGDAPILEGYGSIFNEESEDLGGFVEIIEAGFFDDVMDSDVRCLWNHNADLVLGRTRNNTLTLRQDESGLYYRNLVNAEDREAMDKYRKVQRGDVDQSSFAFRVKRKDYGDEVDGDEWKVIDGKVMRFLKRGGCRELFDVSPVTYPGYQKASVQARSHALAMAKTLEEEQAESRQAAEAADAEKAAQARRMPFESRVETSKRRFLTHEE